MLIYPVNVRQAAVAAAGSIVWGLYNPSATKTVVVKAAQLQMFFDGTAAATLMKYELVKYTGVTVFGGGILATPLYRRSALLASLVGQARALEVDGAVDKAWRVTAAGPTFVDVTTALNNATVNDVQPFPTGEVNGDYFAVGHAGMFNGFKIVLGTSGTVGTLAWEYWNGTAWTALSGVTDPTTGFTAAPGTYIVTFTVPTDWAAQSLNGSASLFYIRAKVLTAYTVDPLLTQGFFEGNPTAVTGTAQAPIPLGAMGRVTQTTTNFQSLWSLPFMMPGDAYRDEAIELAPNELLALRLAAASVIGDNIVGYVESTEV